MRGNPFLGPFEGVGPEMATSVASANKVLISGPTTSDDPRYGFLPQTTGTLIVKIKFSQRYIANMNGIAFSSQILHSKLSVG